MERSGDQMDQEAAAAKDGEEGGVAPAARKTLDSIGAADNIIEALDMAAHEVDRQKESSASRSEEGRSKAAPPNPFMLGLSPSAYVLKSVSFSAEWVSNVLVDSPVILKLRPLQPLDIS